MSNSYYNPSGNPATGASGLSATIRAEFVSIANGFSLLPSFTSGVTGQVLVSQGTGAPTFSAFFSVAPATGVVTQTIQGSSAITLSSTLFESTGLINNYLSHDTRNASGGNAASSDFVATADTGTDTTNYINFGINGSGFSQGSWTISGALDGYLYTQSSNLTLGTATAGKNVYIHVGGTLSANIVGTFSATGLAITGALSATGGFTGNVTGNVSGSAGSATTATTAATANALNAANSYSVVGITATGGFTGNVTGNVSGSAGSATTATTANALNAANSYSVVGITASGAITAVGLTSSSGLTVNSGVSSLQGAATPTSVLTYGATTTVNCSLSNAFRVVMTGNITTLTINNAADGQGITIRFKQDATGGRTVAWPASFRWNGGSIPSLSTAANSIDMLTAAYDSADSTWVATLLKGVQ